MDVRELRIGNLVHEEVLGDVTVVSLSSICQVSAKHLDDDHKVQDVVYSLDWHNVKPIPLTEEWLLKFSAISDEPNTPFFIVKMPRNIGEIRVNPDNNMTWLRHWSQRVAVMNPTSLVYVHQLQNLYYSLTREELEVKS